MALLAGVDGCKDGWVVVWQQDDAPPVVECVAGFEEIISRGPEVVTIDIPIGLLERGTRAADQEARKLLKERACCVFTAPIRPLLKCEDYVSAKSCRLAIEDKALTKQAWAILPKIKAVNCLICSKLQQVVKEGHPEVSFAEMNGRDPVRKSKHSKAGQDARLRLLAGHFPEVESQLQKHGRLCKDLIDAYAMLWTAKRIAAGNAKAFPQIAEKDLRGLVMQIWA